MVIARWVVKKNGSEGTRCSAEPGQCGYCGIDVAFAICYPMTPAQYIARTQTWRPLDIHPGWRTWDGATTKGNK